MIGCWFFEGITEGGKKFIECIEVVKNMSLINFHARGVNFFLLIFGVRKWALMKCLSNSKNGKKGKPKTGTYTLKRYNTEVILYVGAVSPFPLNPI